MKKIIFLIGCVVGLLNLQSCQVFLDNGYIGQVQRIETKDNNMCNYDIGGHLPNITILDTCNKYSIKDTIYYITKIK